MYILLAIAIICISYLFLKQRRFYAKFEEVNSIPGPPTSWFFGSIVDYGKTNADRLRKQVELVKQYGLMVRIWRGSQLSIILSDPEKLKVLLNSKEHISKSSGYNGWKLWLGNGLLTSDGNKWRKHRKIISPAFNFQILEQFRTYMTSNSKILVEKLSEQVGKKSVDIAPFIRNYNLDVVCESAMNTKINAQQSPKTDYMEAADGYMELYIARYFSFFKQYDFLYRLSEDYRSQCDYVDSLKAFTANVIRQRRNERSSKGLQGEFKDEFGIKKPKAFLDLLLDLQGEDIMSDEEIREEIDTFMFSGHDTVTSGTIFCLYELAQHEQIQEEVYEEIREYFYPFKDEDLELQSLQKLPKLDRVIKETLRLHSVVPFIERQLNSAVDFADGVTIPAGTAITILPYAIHHLEQFYPQPDRFDPDRFLQQEVLRRHPFTYIPFSAGPRNCVGEKYAILSMKAAVVKILQNFRLLPAEPNFEPLITNIAVLKSDNGIRVQLQHR